MHPKHYDLGNHCVIQGAPDSGKSKLVEYQCRKMIDRELGFCVMDWHGTLIRELLKYLCYRRPRNPIVLMDLSGDYIRPWNPFALKNGDEVTAHVNRLVSLMVRPWGEKNTNVLPGFERVMKPVLTFSAVSGEPLHHAAMLLNWQNENLRTYAASLIEGDQKQELEELNSITRFQDWKQEIQSSKNRLGRLLGSKRIKLTLGLKREGESVSDWIKKNAIVLVNLTPHPGRLDSESARTFATLLLSEFLDAGIRNTQSPKPYFLMCDECQEYMTPDVAPMLEQVRKSGIRMTLIHHHMGEFDDLRLRQSIEYCCGIKYVFQGLPVPQAKEAGEDFFLDKINQRWIQEVRVHTITKHDEEEYEVVTESDSYGSADNSGTGQHSDSEGIDGRSENTGLTSGWNATTTRSIQKRLVPRYELEETGKDEWSRDEKVGQAAHLIRNVPKQSCHEKLPGKEATLYKVPKVWPVLLSDDRVLRFEKDLHKSAIPINEAETILKTQESDFLERSQVLEPQPKRPKKRPPNLFKQG